MGGAVADSIYAYKWEGRKTGPRRTKKKPHGLYGNIVGSGPWSQRRVVIGLYSWGAMRCVVDANCYVTHGEGKEEGKGAENEFSKKGT